MIGASDPREAASGHHLLPPERWFGVLMLRRQQTNPTPPILRLQQNYGPEGIALYAAALLSGFVGGAVALLGIALLVASGDRGNLLLAGYVMLFVGIGGALMAIMRALQMSYVGRRFRGGRPFVKRS